MDIQTDVRTDEWDKITLLYRTLSPLGPLLKKRITKIYSHHKFFIQKNLLSKSVSISILSVSFIDFSMPKNPGLVINNLVDNIYYMPYAAGISMCN